jgi:hypothetical protein
MLRFKKTQFSKNISHDIFEGKIYKLKLIKNRLPQE